MSFDVIKRNLGWYITTIICAVPVIYWFFLHPVADVADGGFVSISLAVGRVAGLVGLAMYALNLLYSTRLKFIENMFGGLNKVFVAHHILGGLALILLCFHPLFLALNRATYSIRDAAELLVPSGLAPLEALFDSQNNFHFEVLQQWAIFFGILAFWGMVILLIITFFVKLPYQLWLAIHKYLGLAFFFAGLHVFFISSDVSSSTGLRIYMMSLCAIGLLAFVYRTLMPNILVRRYVYNVDSTKVVGGSVTQINMSPESRKLSFKSGQFVFVRFLVPNKKIAKEWHPFSVSSSAKDKNLQISAKSLGDFTSLLPKLPKGTKVQIEGAYGKFSYRNFKNKDQIWIAGGIGITPFLSMAKDLPDDDYKVDLYYCVKSKSELIGAEIFKEVLKHKQSRLKVIPFVSDGPDKLINAKIIKKNSDSLEGKEIFICGPPAMMKSLRNQLIAEGVPKKMIHTEEFSID